MLPAKFQYDEPEGFVSSLKLSPVFYISLNFDVFSDKNLSLFFGGPLLGGPLLGGPLLGGPLLGGPLLGRAPTRAGP